MYCENCGVKIPDDSRFCEHCGKPLTFPGSPDSGRPAPAPDTARGVPVFVSKTKKRSASPDYSRIVLWIQGRYGSRLAPGMDANRVRSELEAIINSERARGIPAKALKGFRSFIDQQQYGMLIQSRR